MMTNVTIYKKKTIVKERLLFCWIKFFIFQQYQVFKRMHLSIYKKWHLYQNDRYHHLFFVSSLLLEKRINLKIYFRLVSSQSLCYLCRYRKTRTTIISCSDYITIVISMPSKIRSTNSSSDLPDLYSMRFAPVPYIRMYFLKF